MGLFDAFKKKTSSVNTATESTPSVDLTKRVDLAKEVVHTICLTKKPLNGLTARVGLVLDYSGSMSILYENGTVQAIVEKILPLALNFDNDGSMEVWIFENGYHRLPDITLANLEGYIERETQKYSMGGTQYAPVMNDVVKTYKNSNIPAYVLFITDGDNSDKRQTDEIIIKSSKQPIFWQFVGVGNAGFDYLQNLDDMEGRFVDNADFFSVDKAENITYNVLLNEFPNWLEYDKVKEMLK